MPQNLAMGALLECTMGLAPMPFSVLPINRVIAGGVPVATIMDNKPMLNIPPFVLCKSPLNPEVAAIIASSLGTVTQGPCMPMIPGPWIPMNPTFIIGEFPYADFSSKLICAYGGVISALVPGQFNLMSS